ncbi:hypothetical protein FOA43_002387 [Brettanomyces nanus]|uniref:ER membrane protein complex subunit 2 n=1 Tax=Eeniella nana TaxID=13502 RepID=A0A875RUX8_EENNA|nr:uncharacterized protein FOA43_002387 [Brettanomyces nanus]QPG75047.1 hypothetical protein FOA43_002387 [Brettanomyces nanus]
MVMLSTSQQLLNFAISKRYLSLNPEELDELYKTCSQYVNDSGQFDGLDVLDQNSLLLLLYQVCLLTCHDIEANATMEKVTDLINDNQLINQQSEWLIYWRSVWLETQAGKSGQLDVVFEYINNSMHKFIKDLNRKVGTTLGAAGDPGKLRSDDDLYVLKKRKASMFQSDPQKYVVKLLELIDLRPLDYETWCELADVYLANGELEKCHYCYLEVLLGLPSAYNIWARMGEVTLLMAKSVNGKASTKYLKNCVRYFSRSVELCELFSRGWCGLYVTLSRLSDKGGDYTTLKQLTNDKLNHIVNAKLANHTEIANIEWILHNY